MRMSTVILVATALCAAPALAAPIGSAVSVERSVTGAGSRLNAGDGVAQDEVISTGDRKSVV